MEESTEASQSNKRSRGSVNQISHSSSEDPFSDKSKSKSKLNVVTPKAAQKDSRTTEQRVLDIHCTFQPTLLTSSHRRKTVESSKQLKGSSDSGAYINDSLGSLALDSSSAPESEYFYGESLADVYKESPYDSINGRNTDGKPPAASESTATSKLATENRIRNDFKSQAGIEKCLAHLRRGKDKREEDLKHNKNLELRNYDLINNKSSDINTETDLDILKKNKVPFLTEARKNSKGMKDLVSPCKDFLGRSPTQRLSCSGDATPSSRGTASPACRSPNGARLKSLNGTPARKTSVSFGSSFIPEPRESFSKLSRKASATSKDKSRSSVITPTIITDSQTAQDEPAYCSVPVESTVSSLFPSVNVDAQEPTTDLVGTGHLLTPDSVSFSPSPVSHSSEKSLQSKDTSVISQGSKGPGGGKNKVRCKSTSPTSRRTASPPKTIGSPAKTVGSPQQPLRSPLIRNAHQKLIGKYQNILAIDVDRFDGSADTFKSLIDLKQ